MYVGVIGGAAVIRLQIRRHANDLQTFLSETTAAPVTLATPKSFGTRYWRGRWSPFWLRCVVFGHDWHQRSSTHPPTLEAFKQDYDLIETVTECQRCGQIGNVKDKLERRQESVSATGAQGRGWNVRDGAQSTRNVSRGSAGGAARPPGKRRQPSRSSSAVGSALPTRGSARRWHR